MPKHSHKHKHHKSESSEDRDRRRGNSSSSSSRRDRDNRSNSSSNRDRNNSNPSDHHHHRNRDDHHHQRDRGGRNNDSRGGNGGGGGGHREDFNFPRGGHHPLPRNSGPITNPWNSMPHLPNRGNVTPWEQQQQWTQPGNSDFNNPSHRRFDHPPPMLPRRQEEQQQQRRYEDDRRGNSSRQHDRGRDDQQRPPWGQNRNNSDSQHGFQNHPAPRNDWEQSKRRRFDQQHSMHYHAAQEGQRLLISQHEPNKIFLEDVDLAPEYAFRIDTRSNTRQLNYSTLNLTNTSRFQPTYRRDDVFGASEEEWMSLPFRSVFTRCVQPVGIDDDGNPVDEDGNIIENTDESNDNTNSSKSTKNSMSTKKRASTVSVASFIGFAKPMNSSSMMSNDKSSRDLTVEGQGGPISKVQIQKPGATLRDRIESYNIDLRKDPKNIPLWRKFVKFQDQVFEQQEEEFTGSTSEPASKKSKNKRNRKALAEKKIAILDKALETNPKSLELHMDKMDTLYEIFKPRYVLGEWKKLATLHQQIGSFCIEYLRFACTDLQLYSTSSVIGIFEKCFQKFRLMMNPNYPSFQRPEKFLLLMADILFSLSLILRNAGYSEKAISFHQAQMELDFNFPHGMISAATADKTLKQGPDVGGEWDKVKPLFELFWDAGTRRFGEPEAPGWVNVLEKKHNVEKKPLGITEAEVSEWEDKFFETVNAAPPLEDSEESSINLLKKMKLPHHWVTIESFRSRIQWLPWRENCSDANECEDSQRVVLANELTPFLTLIHNPPSSAETTQQQGGISNFDRDSTQFRHVVNFLLLLREDFLPRTHTLDTVLSSFSSLSLSKSNTFFSEIYYWKTGIDLYLLKGAEDKIAIPEGFDLYDLVYPSPHENLTYSVCGNTSDEENLLQYPEDIEGLKKEICTKNHDNHLAMVRNVVENCVNHLSPRFSSLLAQMYFRFQQRLCYSNPESHKNRMKSLKLLLQHDKLRNSTALYGEIAMMEFFGTRDKTKTSNLLAKTINSTVSSQALKRDENDESGCGISDINTNWETVAEITKLYRLLAELQLKEDEKLSLKILTALGNQFERVVLEKEDSDVSVDGKAKNEILIARRQFERLLDILIPPSTDENDDSFFSKWDADKSVEFLVQNTSFVLEWTLSYALFLYLSVNLAAANELFTNVLSRISCPRPLSRSTKYQTDVISASNIREQLYVGWCKISMMEVCKDPMQNSKFRDILSEALLEFPSSPPLLLIFSDVEKQSSVAGKIWRSMMSTIKNESASNSLHWAPLFMALSLARKVDDLRQDEEEGLPKFGLGGPAVPPDTIYYKLDAVLSTAEKNSCSRNCPLIWRIHLKLRSLIALRGRKQNGERDVKAAQMVFYEAIRHCPSLKVLYMDALTYFPDSQKMKEIQDLMAEKQLLVRLPPEELNLLLELQPETDDLKKKVLDNSSEEDEQKSEEGDDDIVDISSEPEEDKDCGQGAVNKMETNEIEEIIPPLSTENNDDKVMSVSEGEITDDDDK